MVEGAAHAAARRRSSPRSRGTGSPVSPRQPLEMSGLPPAGVSPPMPEQTALRAARALEGFARGSYAGRTSLAGLATTQYPPHTHTHTLACAAFPARSSRTQALTNSPCRSFRQAPPDSLATLSRLMSHYRAWNPPPPPPHPPFIPACGYHDRSGRHRRGEGGEADRNRTCQRRAIKNSPPAK